MRSLRLLAKGGWWFACLALAAEPGGWQSLFDGKSLDGWAVTKFFDPGQVEVKDGQIILHAGNSLTGVHRPAAPFRTNYEVELEAMRLKGRDFFCGLTFPVGTNCCTFVVGGWGGHLVGVSSLEGLDASMNETGRNFPFQTRRWYRIRVRVTPKRLECWIDKEKFVDLIVTGRRIGMRPGDIESSQPFGIASYETTAALRNIRVRPLPVTEER
ncbi:MAG: DUF1080 domain-containing protein [Verrucomicrobiae bacterium]|nr:DUF1080 domain-containing protein [Verrucomicrobiae bacterium]